MSIPPRSWILPFLLTSTLALAGCDTAEERAENHYKRGLELLDAGDVERASIEFRNVFRLNDSHAPALTEYAEILRAENNLKGAIGHYLRVVEIDPASAGAHRALAELSLQIQDPETAEVHTARAWALDPGHPVTRALRATIEFRRGEDTDAAVAMAAEVLNEAPDNILAHMILIADRLNRDDTAGALELVDTALTHVPDDEGLHLARLAMLEQAGDEAGTGAQLETMAALFSENDGVREALIQWYLRQGNTDGAETVLRGIAERNPDSPEAKLTVVQFLYELRGVEAAREELDRLISGAASPVPYQRALASLDFSEGRTGQAMNSLRDLVRDAEPSDDTRDLRTALAQMLAETGNARESRDLTEAVLAEDPTHVEALKLRARASIDADQPDVAIQDMRTALTRAPRDPEIMTIMAMAHEREGSRELMGERLALAVEISGRGVEESRRYAAFLMQEGRTGPAEGVITDALRHTPENRDLLDMLGRIHLERRDWARAEQVAAILRDHNSPASTAIAGALEIESLRGQGLTEEAVARLESLNDSDGALTELVRTHVEAGNDEAARAHLEKALAENGKNRQARLLLAGLDASTGSLETAETLYRELIAEDPEASQPYKPLFNLLAGQGRVEEAEEVLRTGIERASDNAELLFMQAGILEARNDLAGALEIYELLYEYDPGVPVVANNLASLLTGTGADRENLERAFAIARRLRTSDVPYFQDTYGWIVHLRGNSAEAVEHLSTAAGALPDNALVQFHLGEAAFALGEWDMARKGFTQALAAAEQGSPLPQADQVRERLAAIPTETADDGVEAGTRSN